MVKIVKIVTGEEIIAEIVENLDGTLLMKNPVTLGMVDKNQLGFIGYLPYADLKDGLAISKDRIIFMAPVDSKLENEYQAAFNKIVVPKPSLKIIT
jgi:hypothetical protein